MVMWLTSNDFNVIKIHTMITVVDMASKFRVVIEHHDSFLVFRNPRLKRSFGLAIVYKIALTTVLTTLTVNFVTSTRDQFFRRRP